MRMKIYKGWIGEGDVKFIQFWKGKFLGWKYQCVSLCGFWVGVYWER